MADDEISDHDDLTFDFDESPEEGVEDSSESEERALETSESAAVEESNASENIKSEGGSNGDDTPDHEMEFKLVLILALAVMAITPLGLWYAVKVLMPVKQEVVKIKRKVPTEIILPTFDININDGRLARYAQIQLIVTVSEPEMKEFFTEMDEDGKSRGKLRQIKALILDVMTEKDIKSVLTPEGKNQLKDEIREGMNTLFAQESEGVVRDVYFKHLLVQ